MNLPWWLKMGGKIVLSRIPFGYAIWKSLGIFRHGEMDNYQYAIQVFNKHVEKCGLENSLKGKHILELGPGDGIGTAIIASAYGARATLVDNGRYANRKVLSYRKLNNVLLELGLSPVDISSCNTIEEILIACGAHYHTQGIDSLRDISSASIDFVFSQAVLEHVRKHEFLDTLTELNRILKPGGLSSHRVDLKDHLDSGLNNLRFDEKLWESGFFSSSGFYTNRIRYGEMLNLFSLAGFDVNIVNIEYWDELPVKRDRLAKKFIDLPEDDLKISGFDAILTR